MAAVLLSAGTKGKRSCLPNSRVLIHQPLLYGLQGQQTDIDIHAKDLMRMRERIDENLQNLSLIVGFITIAVAVVVALVTALLALISFQSRVEEFGLHLALGRRRPTLVRKLVGETSLVALAGWAIGLAFGLLLLVVYRDVALESKGILMNVFDSRPILFSLAVPILSSLVAAIALSRQLRRMDPVAVLQRRGT